MHAYLSRLSDDSSAKGNSNSSGASFPKTYELQSGIRKRRLLASEQAILSLALSCTSSLSLPLVYGYSCCSWPDLGMKECFFFWWLCSYKTWRTMLIAGNTPRAFMFVLILAAPHGQINTSRLLKLLDIQRCLLI